MLSTKASLPKLVRLARLDPAIFPPSSRPPRHHHNPCVIRGRSRPSGHLCQNGAKALTSPRACGCVNAAWATQASPDSMPTRIYLTAADIPHLSPSTHQNRLWLLMFCALCRDALLCRA